jgi:putative membrane protein
LAAAAGTARAADPAQSDPSQTGYQSQTGAGAPTQSGAVDSQPTTSAGSQQYSAADMKSASKVLSDLHRTNYFEIEAGKVAQDKSQNAAVKNFADMLVSDHQKSQDQVASLAQQMNITLQEKSKALGEKESMKLSKLKGMKGSSFDRSFAQNMVEDHKKAISRLEGYQKEATGPTAELISQTLPILRQHQQAAEQLVIDVNSPNKPS